MPDPQLERRRQRLTEAQRREQILEATLVVVGTRGYERASLARIAEQAQVSKGLVSHYFEDKDDLLEAAIGVAAARLRDAVAGELDLTAPVPEVLRGAVHQLLRLRITHQVELTAVREIATSLRRPDGTPRLDLGSYEQTYQAQERLFRRGQAEGSLREFDTRVMAATYQGALDTMLAYAQAYPDTDVEHYADSLADLLVAAVELR